MNGITELFISPNKGLRRHFFAQTHTFTQIIHYVAEFPVNQWLLPSTNFLDFHRFYTRCKYTHIHTDTTFSWCIFSLEWFSDFFRRKYEDLENGIHYKISKIHKTGNARLNHRFQIVKRTRKRINLTTTKICSNHNKLFNQA